MTWGRCISCSPVGCACFFPYLFLLPCPAAVVFCYQGCAPEVSVMQRILTLRGLVLTPEQDIHSWLQFASLCRITKNFRLSKKVRPQKTIRNFNMPQCRKCCDFSKDKFQSVMNLERKVDMFNWYVRCKTARLHRDGKNESAVLTF